MRKTGLQTPKLKRLAEIVSAQAIQQQEKMEYAQTNGSSNANGGGNGNGNGNGISGGDGQGMDQHHHPRQMEMIDGMA